MGIHDGVDMVELRWIMADEARRKLGDPGANAVRISRQISRPERAAFADTGYAFIGIDQDDRSVKSRVRLRRPTVAPLPHGKICPKHAYLANSHG